jgi:hypothetical protein
LQEKLKYSEKTCPSATLSTTNPTLPDLGSNSGRRGAKRATKLLSYGAALTGRIARPATSVTYARIINIIFLKMLLEVMAHHNDRAV